MIGFAISFIGGLAFGVAACTVPYLTIRKRRRAKADHEPAVMPAVVADIQPAPEAKVGDSPPIDSPAEADLDKALTNMVYRAIVRKEADLSLAITFPEKCRIFGQEVSAKGTVCIEQHRTEDEVWEAIRVVGRRVSEVEESIAKRMSEIEARLESANNGAEEAPTEMIDSKEPEAEVQPII